MARNLTESARSEMFIQYFHSLDPDKFFLVHKQRKLIFFLNSLPMVFKQTCINDRLLIKCMYTPPHTDLCEGVREKTNQLILCKPCRLVDMVMSEGQR